jgi:hypothetical protein
MPTRRFAILSASIAALCAITVIVPAFAQATGRGCPAMKVPDPYNNGMMDLDEAEKAASVLFDRLNRDNGGTLDTKKLKGRMTKAELPTVDPDHDGMLDKGAFLKVVEASFRVPNPDKDGTIDCRELRIPTGKSLLRLLEK